MLEQTIKIIKNAGYLIKFLRDNKKLTISSKKDNSLVTSADLESEQVIMEQLYTTFGKDIIILSEEKISNNIIPEIKDNDKFWLIDPIDATASYANGLNDYCINIAYLENREPIISLIYAPETHTLWYAVKNKGAFMQIKDESPSRISCRALPKDGATAVTSRKRHQLTEDIIKKYNITKELVVASAIKFCYIAEGKADYYFRKRNKACEWDVASGILIVEEAGGNIHYLDNPFFNFGNPPFLAPSFIVTGKQH